MRHARVVQCGCLLLGVCETFQRVSQRGYTSPFVLQGPNLGNLVACVLLMNKATMPSFIHSYITCQTSVTNIPARAAAGRRGQNVRYIPAVWQRPTSGHVRPPSKHVPVVSSCCRFERPARASLSLSFSSHRLAKQYVASFRWLLSFWPCWSSATRQVVVLANGAAGWTWRVADEGSN